jgi:hypothetical protein
MLMAPRWEVKNATNRKENVYLRSCIYFSRAMINERKKINR